MIKIMADRAADIPKNLIEKFDIAVLPFIVNVGGKSITADAEYSAEAFYDEVRQAEDIPTTSQMSPSDIENMFRSLTADGSSVIYVSISARGSGINNTANMVAAELRGEGLDITVIDSEMFSYAIGAPVVKAAEMAESGAGKDEIISFLNESFKRDTAYFVVDDLTFLKKGGRIKATTMAVSQVLDIKPILNISDGLVEAYKKVRGIKKAILALVGYIDERMESPSENELVILHSDAADKVNILKSQIESRGISPESIRIINIGPIITAHAGLGLVGVYFKHKKPYTEYEN